jgi:hypothetical protein
MPTLLLLAALMLAPPEAWAALKGLVLEGQLSLQALGLGGLLFLLYLSLKV